MWMMSAPTLTIAGCTRNRGPLLERAVESILREVQSSSLATDATLELLVVDNGSSDDTADRLHRLMEREARLRMVHEPTPGISVARNRVLSEARNDVILWFDDDITVMPGWLDAHLEMYRTQPDCVAVGGAIELYFDTRRPTWLDRAMEANLAAFDLDSGHVERITSSERLPFGANMSLRRDAMLSVGGFDGALGRVDQSLISGEETAVLEALRRQGASMWLTGDARVYHHIPSERTTLRWMARRTYGQGRTDQRMRRDMALPEAGARLVLGGFRHVFRHLRTPKAAIAGYVFQRAYWAGRIAEIVSPGGVSLRRR